MLLFLNLFKGTRFVKGSYCLNWCYRWLRALSPSPNSSRFANLTFLDSIWLLGCGWGTCSGSFGLPKVLPKANISGRAISFNFLGWCFLD